MQWYQLDHMQTICTSLQTDNHTHTPSLNFFRPDACPGGQTTTDVVTISCQVCDKCVLHTDSGSGASSPSMCHAILLPLSMRALLCLCTKQRQYRHFSYVKNETVHAMHAISLRTIKLFLDVPSVLWHCWLGGRKGIWPVKNWVVGCWHGYLSGARWRLAYGPADATATHCLLLQ